MSRLSCFVSVGHLGRATILALGLVLVAGCQSNVGAGVSLAQARATCLAFDNDLAGLDALILIAEAARDDGLAETEFIAATTSVCFDPGVNPSGCNLCFSQIAAAVWR